MESEYQLMEQYAVTLDASGIGWIRAQTVFIGPDSSVTIKSSDSVWAITAGTVNTLGVLIEFTVSN